MLAVGNWRFGTTCRRFEGCCPKIPFTSHQLRFLTTHYGIRLGYDTAEARNLARGQYGPLPFLNLAGGQYGPLPFLNLAGGQYGPLPFLSLAGGQYGPLPFLSLAGGQYGPLPFLNLTDFVTSQPFVHLLHYVTPQLKLNTFLFKSDERLKDYELYAVS